MQIHRVVQEYDIILNDDFQDLVTAAGSLFLSSHLQFTYSRIPLPWMEPRCSWIPKFSSQLFLPSWTGRFGPKIHKMTKSEWRDATTQSSLISLSLGIKLRESKSKIRKEIHRFSTPMISIGTPVKKTGQSVMVASGKVRDCLTWDGKRKPQSAHRVTAKEQTGSFILDLGIVEGRRDRAKNMLPVGLLMVLCSVSKVQFSSIRHNTQPKQKHALLSGGHVSTFLFPSTCPKTVLVVHRDETESWDIDKIAKLSNAVEIAEIASRCNFLREGEAINPLGNAGSRFHKLTLTRSVDPSMTGWEWWGEIATGLGFPKPGCRPFRPSNGGHEEQSLQIWLIRPHRILGTTGHLLLPLPWRSFPAHSEVNYPSYCGALQVLCSLSASTWRLKPS